MTLMGWLLIKNTLVDPIKIKLQVAMKQAQKAYNLD